MSGIRPPDCSKLAKNPKNENDVILSRHDVNVKFFDIVLFPLSSLVTGPSFMPISSLVLKLWQFSFIKDWPEIRKSEIPMSEFFPISEDWGELWIPNLAKMSLIECYWMLQNNRVTAFIVFELLRENQLGDKIIPPPQTKIRVNTPDSSVDLTLFIISFISSFEIINVVLRRATSIGRQPDPNNFLWIVAYVADALAVNPNGIKKFSANG